ncbi:Uncharacterised protein [Halioglobus japonicus]|nr:Uncharacterised protein [Halioglobus japonicus]
MTITKLTSTLSTFILYFFIVTSLVACGGGGGGGGGGVGGTPGGSGGSDGNSPQAIYDGPSEPVAIQRTNAIEVAKLAFEGRVAISLAEQIWIKVPDARVVQASTETINGSGGGTATVKVEVDGQVVTVTVTYNNFSEEGTTLSGVTVQRTEPRTGDIDGPIYSTISGSYRFQNLRVTADGTNTVMDGVVTSQGNDSRRIVANLVLSDLVTGESLLMENYAVDFSLVTEESDSHIASAISGVSYDSTLGKITIATVTPIIDLQLYEPLDMWSGRGNGVLEIQGQNEALQFMAISPRFAGLSLDEDEDGVFELSLRVPWSVLNENEDFIVKDRDSIPVANAGAEFTSYVGIPTVVHGHYSHDEDGQFLTQSWELVHAPPGSLLSREPQLGASFVFAPDVKGDFLFRLTVDDGGHRQVATTRVQVLDRPEIGPRPSGLRPLGTISGSLEVLYPGDGRTAYNFSALSAIWYGADEEARSSWWFRKPRESTSSSGMLVRADNLRSAVAQDPENGELLTVGFRPRDYGGDGVRTSLTNTDLSLSYAVEIGIGTAVSVKSLDFNADGVDDFAAHTHSEEGVNLDIWTGDGKGNYKRVVRHPIDQAFPTLGDINNDGRPDLVVETGIGLNIFRQGNEGQLFPPEYVYYNDSINWPRKIGLGDFDGDGLDDLLALNPASNKLEVWLQSPNGWLGVSSIYAIPTDVSLQQLAFEDFNDDGLVDIAAGAILNPGKLQIFLNKGSGFELASSYSNEGLFNAPGVAGGDFTGDGRADVIQYDGRYIHFYEQLPSGGLELYQKLDRSSVSIDQVTHFADVDDDGDIDLVVASQYDLWILLHEAGKFKIIDLGSYHAQNWPEAITVLDYNNDGINDIVVPGSGIIVFLGGLSPTSHAPPVEAEAPTH